MPEPTNPYDDFLNQDTAELAPGEAPQPYNPYNDILSQEASENKQERASALSQAAQSSPDKTAGLRNLARDLGMAPAALEYANPQTSKLMELTSEIDKNTSDAQILGRLLQDPEFAKLAFDDTEQLSGIERFLSGIGGKGIKRGILQDQVGGPAFEMLMGFDLSPKKQARFDDLQRQMYLNEMRGGDPLVSNDRTGAAGRTLRSLSWLLNTTSYTATQLFTALPTALGTAGAGAATGAGIGAGGALIAGQLGPQVAAPEEVVTVPAAAFGGALTGGRTGYITGQTFYNFRQEAGFAFLEYRDFRDANGQPLPDEVARGAAIVAGAANAGLETVADITLAKFVIPGADKLLSKPGKEVVRQLMLTTEGRDAMAELGKKALKASGTEGATEIFQEAVTILTGEAAKGFITPTQEFEAITLDDATERMLESGLAGAVGGAGVTFTLSPGASYITNLATKALFGEQQEKIATATGELAKVQAALDAASKSKLAARAPDLLQQFVDEAAADSPLSSVYVSAESFAQVAEAAGQDPAELARLFGVEAQLRDAEGTGSDIEISMGAFIATLANNELAGPMMEIVKTNPFLPSKAEMKELTDAGQEALIAEAERLAHKATKDAAFGESAKAVKADVARQLAGTGRYDGRTNALYASVTAQAYSVLSSRLGVTPEEAYARYPLSIVAPAANAPTDETYKQFVGQNSQDPAVQARFIRAEEMMAQGATREEIWQETMVFAGKDGKLRAEVSDYNAKLLSVAEQLLSGLQAPDVVQGALGLIFNSPALEKSYPGISRRIRTQLEKREGRASGFMAYNPFTNDPDRIEAAGETSEDLREVLIHEIQHLAQKLGGLQQGGNPAEIRANAGGRWTDLLRAELRKIFDGINDFREIQRAQVEEGTLTAESDPFGTAYAPIKWADLPRAAQDNLKDQAAEEVYYKLLGEVEARAAQARRDMTEEERRANPPWIEMERDVPEDEQILQQGRRGEYYPNLAEIRLTPQANFSTYLHELGHHFLAVYLRVSYELVVRQDNGAALTAAEQEIVNDARKLIPELAKQAGVQEMSFQEIRDGAALTAEERRVLLEDPDTDSFGQAYTAPGKRPSGIDEKAPRGTATFFDPRLGPEGSNFNKTVEMAINGYSNAEIAEELGLKINSVKVYLSRARKEFGIDIKRGFTPAGKLRTETGTMEDVLAAKKRGSSVQQISLATGKPESNVRAMLSLARRRWVEANQGPLPTWLATNGGFVLFQNDTPIFYSRLIRAVNDSKMTVGTGQQWLGALRNAAGVKADELAWTGLEEMLSLHDGKFTKEQIQAYLNAKGLVIEDVELSGLDAQYPDSTLPGGEAYKELMLILPPGGDAKRTSGRLEVFPPEGVDPDDLLDDLLTALAAEGLEHLDYGRSYSVVDGKPYLSFDGFNGADMDVLNRAIAEHRLGPEVFYFAVKQERGTKDTFRSGHWPEQNVLAHVRFKIRTTADGRRVLALEEIQSDWHQKGRTAGYVGQAEQAASDALDRAQAAYDAIMAQARALFPGEADVFRALRAQAQTNAAMGTLLGQLLQAGIDLQVATGTYSGVTNRGAVPDAPFKPTAAWTELVLKRMIRYAAEQGLDEISWIPGYIQNGKMAPRGDNRGKFYDSIVVNTANKLGKKYGAKVHTLSLGAERSDRHKHNLISLLDRYNLALRNEEETVLVRQRLLAEDPSDVNARRLNDAEREVSIRRDQIDILEEQIANLEVVKDWAVYGSLNGVNLLGSFDSQQEAVAFAQEKGLDPQDVVAHEPQDIKFHSLPITDDLRNTALTEGFPLFQNAPVFYSALSRAVERSGLAKGPAEQWKGILRNAPGAKQEEMDWTGVMEWLDAQEGPVPQQALKDYLDANGVKVEVLANMEQPRPYSPEDALEGGEPAISFEDWRQENEERISELESELRSAAFYSQYSPPALRVVQLNPRPSEAQIAEGERRAAQARAQMEEALNVGRNNEADTARRRAEAFERAVAQARSILERDTQTGDLFANDRQAAPPMAEMWVIVNEYDDLVDGYGDTENLSLEDALAEILGNGALNSINVFPSENSAEREMERALERHLDNEQEGFEQYDDRFYIEAEEQLMAEDGISPNDAGRPGERTPGIVKWAQYNLPGAAQIREILLTLPTDKIGAKRAERSFTESHWPNVPNLLAHVRVSTRFRDGKHVLFIEEMQSDWHQKGRDAGYGTLSREEFTRLNKIVDDMTKELMALGRRRDFDEDMFDADGQPTEAYATLTQRMGTLQAERDKVMAEITASRVPDAPFKNNAWAALAMKRMVRWAAENGFDEVAWTPAKVHIDRWSRYAQPEGMKLFYDKILPQAATAIGKKYGAKPEVVHMAFGREKMQVLTLPLTEELKTAALEEGFPLFQKSPGFYSQLLRVAEGSTLKSASAEQWLATLRNAPGVKAEEIEWTGVEDWLKSKAERPGANRAEPISKDDLVNYLARNGVVVETLVADREPNENGEDLAFGDGEVWDDREAWEHDIEFWEEQLREDLENYASSAQYDDWKSTAATDRAESNPERYQEYLGEDYTPDAAVDYILENEDLDDDILTLAESWIGEAAERYAEDAYRDNPVYIYEAEAGGNTLYIFGNDDTGYDIRLNGNTWRHSIFAGRQQPFIASYSEAEIQALDYARDRDWLVDEDAPNATRWSSYVTQGRHTDYREIKLTLPEVDGTFLNSSHFDDENIVAFVRATRRQLSPAQLSARNTGLRLYLENGNVVVKDDNDRVLTSFPASSDVTLESAQLQLQRGLATPGAVLIRSLGIVATSNGDGTVRVVEDAAPKDTFFIEELQSDWHQTARQGIYDTPEERARAEAELVKANEALVANSNELSSYAETVDRTVLDNMIPIARWYVRTVGGGYTLSAGAEGAFRIDAMVAITEGMGVDDLTSRQQQGLLSYARSAFNVAVSQLSTNQERGGRRLPPDETAAMPAALRAVAARQAELEDARDAAIKRLDKVERALRRPTPNAPFKGDAWINLALKQSILMAVEEGKTGFAWANSRVLKDRWSERYSTLYENIYDSKMVKAVQKLLGVKPQLRNFNGSADDGADPGAQGYWFVEIPDEIAQKIKNDGFALFQEGQPQDQTPPMPEGMDPLKWFDSLTFSQTVPLHEQFARMTEAYFLDGKAPTPELQGMFSSLRRWMLNVYQDIKELDVDLNDEVRGVMDRMLAAQRDVATANENRALGALFSSKPSFMSDLEWDVYLRLAENAVDDAEEELTRRSLRDMKWLSNARSKALRELQAQAKEQRKVVAAEVANEVLSEPVNVARNFFKRGINPDGSPVQGPSKLSAPALAQAYPEGSGVDWQKLGYGRYGILGQEGLDADTAAEILGYPSGDALVRDLLAAPDAQQKIRDETDTRMLERFGELASPQDMERAADEAVHSQLRSRVLAAEYAALAKATGKPDRLLSQAAQAAAKQLVGRLVASKLNPQKYIAAARRSGREAEAALRKGDLAAAAAAKRDQILNYEISREIQRVLKERNSALNFFQRVITAKRDNVARTRNYDLVQAARAILSVYGLGRVKNEVPEYLDAIKAYDPTLYASLEPTLLGAMTTRDTLDKLTVDKLLGLRDLIRQLWDLAREEKVVEIDGQKVELQDVVDKLSKRLEDLGATGAAAPTEAATDWQKTLRKLSGMRAGMRRVEAWARLIDGNRAGWFTRYLFRPVSEAADRYRRDRNNYIVKFRELFSRIEPNMRAGKINAPEINYTFRDKSELLHAILHTGNRSNLRKLLLGRGWGADLGDGQMDTSRWDSFIRRMAKEKVLVKEDFDFAQGVWDLLDETKPLAQEAHRKVFGRYFAEITADEVQTPFGTYRGGYVPAIYDDYYVQDASLRAEQDAIEASDSTMFPTPASGFTKGRVEYNQVLALDLRLLPQHIDKVLKFAHLAAPVRAVLRILRNKQFARVLESYDPVAQSDLLLPWLQRAARQIVETPTKGQGGKMVDGFFRAVRVRSGMGLMFANLVNVAQQVTGFSLAAIRVKPHYLAGALTHYMRNPKGITQAINQASPMMADRMDNQLSQMYGEIEKIIDRNNKYGQVKGWFQRHAYWFQQAVQNVMDIIIWKGAYDQAQHDGMTEIEAAREADSAVRQTQGSVLPEDVSRVESGSAFFRSFVHMYTYFNMWANLLSTEFRHIVREFGLRKGAGRLLYLYVMGFAVPALFAEFIAQGLRGQLPDDEDDDGYWDEYLQWAIGAQAKTATAFVPVGGQALNATMGAFNDLPYDDRVGASPAISAIESTVRTPAGIYDLAMGEGDASRTVKDVLTSMTLITGLPFASLGRPVGYAVDVAEGDIEPTDTLDYVRGLATGSASEASR